jgi:hypothetical protein
MKRLVVSSVAALALLALFHPGRASAQVPGARPTLGYNPYQRPTISPYLNLARGGNPAINYYGLVRPQIEQQQAIQQLQGQQNLFQQTLLQQPTAALNTGHPTSFLSHSRYFLNRGATSSLGGVPIGGAQFGARAPLQFQQSVTPTVTGAVVPGVVVPGTGTPRTIVPIR